MGPPDAVTSVVRRARAPVGERPLGGSRRTATPSLVALVALVALMTAACAVPRSVPPPSSKTDFSTLPNLRRAREALEDRIAREREYAAALMAQLEQWQDQEDRIFKDYLQAEHDFQLISSDLAGTEQDLADATKELADLKAELANQRKQLTTVRTELQSALDELIRLHGLSTEIEALAARLAEGAPAAEAAGGEGGSSDDGGDAGG